MKIAGDTLGVAALKALAERDRAYLKFLINEARSNTDLCTTFKSVEGQPFRLRIDPKSGDFVVEPAAK